MLEVVLDGTIEDSISFRRFGAQEKGFMPSGGACIDVFDVLELE
jgi:hypothetical protein